MIDKPLVGLTGRPPAGSGKDVLSEFLVKEFGFVRVALADPMKRFCSEMFGWPATALWGESSRRNQLDFKYPRITQNTKQSRPRRYTATKTRQDSGANFVEYLTPRYALQSLGDWGRDCHENLWVDKLMQVVDQLLDPVCNSHGMTAYDCKVGLVSLLPYMERTQVCNGVVVPDVRFDNEAEAIREAGGKIWCITRPGAGLEGEAAYHCSEVGVSDCFTDEWIANDGTFTHLYDQARYLLGKEQP